MNWSTKNYLIKVNIDQEYNNKIIRNAKKEHLYFSKKKKKKLTVTWGNNGSCICIWSHSEVLAACPTHHEYVMSMTQAVLALGDGKHGICHGSILELTDKRENLFNIQNKNEN